MSLVADVETLVALGRQLEEASGQSADEYLTVAAELRSLAADQRAKAPA